MMKNLAEVEYRRSELDSKCYDCKYIAYWNLDFGFFLNVPHRKKCMYNQEIYQVVASYYYI